MALGELDLSTTIDSQTSRLLWVWGSWSWISGSHLNLFSVLSLICLQGTTQMTSVPSMSKPRFMRSPCLSVRWPRHYPQYHCSTRCQWTGALGAGMASLVTSKLFVLITGKFFFFSENNHWEKDTREFTKAASLFSNVPEICCVDKKHPWFPAIAWLRSDLQDTEVGLPCLWHRHLQTAFAIKDKSRHLLLCFLTFTPFLLLLNVSSI